MLFSQETSFCFVLEVVDAGDFSFVFPVSVPPLPSQEIVDFGGIGR